MCVYVYECDCVYLCRAVVRDLRWCGLFILLALCQTEAPAEMTKEDMME